MKTPPPTLDQALEFFDRASQRLEKIQRPAEGFFTAAELAKAQRTVTVFTVRYHLDRMVTAKRAEVREGRVCGKKTKFYGNFK